MGSIIPTRMLPRGILLLFLFSSGSSNILDDLIPGVDFEKSSCDVDGICFRENTVLVDNTFWVDEESGLKYHQPRLFYVNTKDLVGKCGKGVKKQLADSIEDCEDKPLEDICEFKNKGWLKKDSNPDSDAIFKAFEPISEAESIISDCLQVEPPYNYEYEYDYYDYIYDSYDYRHRNRRQANQGVERAGRNRRADKKVSKKGGRKFVKPGNQGGPKKADKDK